MLNRLKHLLRTRLGQDRMLDLYYYPRERLLRAAGLFAPAVKPEQVAVVSMWDARQADLAAITSPNKAAYCSRWGYHWIPRTSGFDPARPVAWSKLRFIQEALSSHAWVFWSDPDSLITNPALSLAPLLRTRAGIIITRDQVGYNSGSFLLRRCPWTLAFLETAWDFPATDEYRSEYDLHTDRLWENRAIDLLLRKKHHRSQVRVVRQNRLNSYLPALTACDPEGAYRPGDFVLHLPGVAHETRLRELSARAAALAP